MTIIQLFIFRCGSKIDVHAESDKQPALTKTRGALPMIIRNQINS